MLRIDMMKGPNKFFINKISEDDKILALFDDIKQKIDLSCIMDRHNEKVIVITYKEEKDGQYTLDCIDTKILKGVDKTEDGVMFLSFED